MVWYQKHEIDVTYFNQFDEVGESSQVLCCRGILPYLADDSRPL